MRKFNSYLIYICIAIFIISCSISSFAQAQISIVVSKSSTQKANLDFLKQAFAGTKVTWANGNKVQIADQADTETGKIFYSKFIGKSVSSCRSQWMKLVLSGQASSPIKCKDDESVKKAVAESPNTVGFISSGSLDNTVKEIGKIE